MWFTTKNKREKEIMAAEMRLVDRAVEVYRDKKELEVEQEVDHQAERVIKAKLEAAENMIECVKQNADAEHDFHSGVEERKVELAKLDAQIEAKEALVSKMDAVHQADVQAWDKVIVRVESENKYLREIIQNNFPKLLEKSAQAPVTVNNTN